MIKLSDKCNNDPQLKKREKNNKELLLVFGDEEGNIVWADLTKFLTTPAPKYSTLKVGFVADRPTKC